MALIETRLPASAPELASSSSSSGIAVISLDLSATARCPSTRLWVVALAETRCSAAWPLPRSWLRREVLPPAFAGAGYGNLAHRTR